MNSNHADMHGYFSSFVYLHTFANTDVGVFLFLLKCAKLSTFCISQTFATTNAVALIMHHNLCTTILVAFKNV